MDGYIARSFYRQAEVYLSHLLKTRNFRQLCQTLQSPSGTAFVVRSNASRLLSSQPVAWDHTGVPLWVLDYAIKNIGTVVPQTLWTPLNKKDLKQHVEEADLQFPIFFIHENGDLGLSLEDAVNGRCYSALRDARTHAQLGGKTTTHIRILVGSGQLTRLRSTCIDTYMCRSGQDTRITSDRFRLETRPLPIIQLLLGGLHIMLAVW